MNSVLTPPADPNVGPNETIAVYDNGTLNDMGNNLIAGDIELGTDGSGLGWSLTNRGMIVTGTLGVANGTLVLTAADSVTGSMNIGSGGSVTLDPTNLNLTGSLELTNGGSLDARGDGISANEILIGYNGSSAASLMNPGTITTNELFMGNGSSLALHGGDIVNSQIMFTQNSVLTVQQTNGIGLTFNGTSASSLSIDPSQMDLVFTLNSGWDFRWLDPSGGGNWIGTLDTMISDGQIVISSPDGYSVVDQGGYTFIMAGMSAAVPEPSSLVLLAVGAAASLLGINRRRKKT